MGIRAFLAFDIPVRVQDFLQEVIGQLQRQYPRSSVRWVNPSQMHGTLHFLGNEVSESAIAALRTEGRRLCAEIGTLEFETESVGTFPPDGEPRIIFLGCTGSGVRPLSGLRERFGRLIAVLNIPMDRRVWQPHLTLGRVRIGGAQRPQAVPLAPQSFMVTAVTLYQSRLTPTGPVYDQLERFPFSGNG